MVKLLADCTVEDARKYNSRLVRPRRSVNKKGKETVSKDIVYLNVVYDEDSTESLSEVLQKGIGVADVLTVKDLDAFSGVREVPEELHNRVQVFVDYDERVDALKSIPAGVRVIAELPKETRNYDIFKLAEECTSSAGALRFVGNVMLRTDGLKIGRFDEGELPGLKDLPGASVSSKFDEFEEVNLEDLSGVEEGSKPKALRTSTTKSRNSNQSIGLIDLDEEDHPIKKAPKKSKPTKSSLRVGLLANRGGKR